MRTCSAQSLVNKSVVCKQGQSTLIDACTLFSAPPEDKMPYVFVSTQIRLENSPCNVGDEHSDPDLMRALDAELIKVMGNNFLEWRTELLPRQVLDRLEGLGYSLAGVTGIGQTCIWTMHKPLEKTESSALSEQQAVTIPTIQVTNGQNQELTTGN